MAEMVTLNLGGLNADPPSDLVHHAVTSALIDVLLSMPSLPPELVFLLRELQQPHTDRRRALWLSSEISALCREAQARQGR